MRVATCLQTRAIDRPLSSAYANSLRDVYALLTNQNAASHLRQSGRLSVRQTSDTHLCVTLSTVVCFIFRLPNPPLANVDFYHRELGRVLPSPPANLEKDACIIINQKLGSLANMAPKHVLLSPA